MSQNISYDRPVPDWALPVARIVFAMALIFLTYNSVKPASASVGIPNFDKVLHAGAYFVLAALFALAMPRLRLIWVIILPCLYGGGLEIAQGLMALGRTGSFFDLVANLSGAALAVLCWWVLARFILKHPA